MGRAQGKAGEDGTPSPLARLSRRALLMGSKSKSGLRKLYCYGSKVPLKATKPGVAPTPSQALPSIPSLPPLPPRAAWSHARGALGRVNHCKNKDLKGSPIGEPSTASSRARGRGRPRWWSFLSQPEKAPQPSVGWEPHPTIPRRRRPHNLAPPEGLLEVGRGGSGCPPSNPTHSHNPTKQKHKAPGFFLGALGKYFETWKKISGSTNLKKKKLHNLN